MKGTPCAEKILASLATHPDLDPDALRAPIKATRLLGLTCGTQLAQYRNSGEPLQMAFADVRRLVLVARGCEAISRTCPSDGRRSQRGGGLITPRISDSRSSSSSLSLDFPRGKPPSSLRSPPTPWAAGSKKSRSLPEKKPWAPS